MGLLSLQQHCFEEILERLSDFDVASVQSASCTALDLVASGFGATKVCHYDSVMASSLLIVLATADLLTGRPQLAR